MAWRKLRLCFLWLTVKLKIRRGNRENKVLAYKQNLNNESEEGTKITVLKIISDQLVDPPNSGVELFSLAKLCNELFMYVWLQIKNTIRAEQQKLQQ